ncbi:hypothetical protein VFPPC_18104 [Pochonia chlamydosporia 170]|uniref:Uncharacterized protein n=1 Tax=Pochonia chlamydosporia 170 TaxID=1380566 RepID=A0A219APR0_METCM|nr:hypothetical protein VFPPC_18104 [Pochonia chlamydosporia 170]OWT42691.1 hypothetical protein VFPPC_18104 [Pochonia chlamydosporia 170]
MLTYPARQVLYGVRACEEYVRVQCRNRWWGTGLECPSQTCWKKKGRQRERADTRRLASHVSTEPSWLTTVSFRLVLTKHASLNDRDTTAHVSQAFLPLGNVEYELQTRPDHTWTRPDQMLQTNWEPRAQRTGVVSFPLGKPNSLLTVVSIPCLTTLPALPGLKTCTAVPRQSMYCTTRKRTRPLVMCLAILRPGGPFSLVNSKVSTVPLRRRKTSAYARRAFASEPQDEPDKLGNGSLLCQNNPQDMSYRRGQLQLQKKAV